MTYLNPNSYWQRDYEAAEAAANEAARLHASLTPAAIADLRVAHERELLAEAQQQAAKATTARAREYSSSRVAAHQARVAQAEADAALLQKVAA